MSNVKCGICGEKTTHFDRGRIMGKYDIDYYRCPVCGFVQTEEPYWLDEAYSSAITDSDIGLVGRNIQNSIVVSAFLKSILKIFWGGTGAQYLDYAGGYGMFVRLMRDNGFDFEWYDQYCTNLFATGHERAKEHYDAATSFELFEHIYNPAQNLGELFQSCDNLIATTSLISKNNPPKVNEWWYYCTDHGQHISFYTRESMEILAALFGKHFASNGGFHLFTARPVNEKTMYLCRRLSRLINRIIRYPSLLPADYEKITGKPL